MKKKRLLALMLSLAMALSFVPQVGAKAADETATVTDATPDMTAQERTVAADPISLGEIDIGVERPEVGGTPDTTLEFNDQEVYATCTGEAPNGVKLGWTKVTDDGEEAFTKFEYSARYKLTIMVNPVNGYVVDDNTGIVILGVWHGHLQAIESGGTKYYVCSASYSTPVDPSGLTLVESADLNIELPPVGSEIVITEGVGPNFAPTVSTSNANIEYADGSLISGFPDDEGEYGRGFEGTIEEGKYYYVAVWMEAKEGYKFSKDTKFVVNGECRLDYFSEEDPQYIALIVRVRAGGDENYTILDGGGQILYYGDDLTVRASGALEDLDHLEIDGKELDLQFVKLKSGSTIATIAASFLETLSEGEHTLTFVYYYGKVSTKFTIKKAANDSVKTGDTAPVAMMAGLMICALAGMAFLKKKEY